MASQGGVAVAGLKNTRTGQDSSGAKDIMTKVGNVEACEHAQWFGSLS